MGKSMVDGFEVFGNDIAAFAAVGFLDHILDAVHCFFARQHTRDCEEAGLQHRVDPAAKPRVARNLRRVNDKQSQAFVDDLLLDRARQAIPCLIRLIRAVEEEGGSGRCKSQDVDLV